MSDKKRSVPPGMRDMKKWSLNRRSFLKKAAAAGALAVLPYAGYKLGSAVKEMEGTTANGDESYRLTEEQFRRLQQVQDILFPSEKEAPGARDVNAAEYLQAVLLDRHVDPDERRYLINGLDWLEEEALERWEKSFVNMLPLEREALLEHLTTHNWGESWLASLLLFIFEALLSDPIYGGNTGEAGWKWLEHVPGQPRPRHKLKYYETN